MPLGRGSRYKVERRAENRGETRSVNSITRSAPVVSIITICFRNPDELRRTVHGVRGVDRSLIEFIMVDGSPDDSCVVEAKSIADVYVHERDRGKYDAMNKGLARARGVTAIFINSGDQLLSPDVLNEIATRHKSELENSIVYCDALIELAGEQFAMPTPEMTSEDIRVGRFPNHQATFIPMSFYATHKYDESMHVSADAKLMKEAFRSLPHLHLNRALVVFAHGGCSTISGTWASVFRHYRESVEVTEMTRTEKLKMLASLFRRKLLLSILGRRSFDALKLASLRRSRSKPAKSGRII